MSEELSKEEREEIEELLRGVRGLTKAGGYEEIPKELILEQAKKVGLSKEDIPEVVVEEGIRGGYIEKPSEGGTRIVIPRRQSKWKVPGILRHELMHYKQGYVGVTEETTWGEYIDRELEAEEAKIGRKTADNISSVALTMVLEEGVGQENAIRIVSGVARDRGYSEHSITSAKKWLRSHFKRLKELRELIRGI